MALSTLGASQERTPGPSRAPSNQPRGLEATADALEPRRALPGWRVRPPAGEDRGSRAARGRLSPAQRSPRQTLRAQLPALGADGPLPPRSPPRTEVALASWGAARTARSASLLRDPGQRPSLPAPPACGPGHVATGVLGSSGHAGWGGGGSGQGWPDLRPGPPAERRGPTGPGEDAPGGLPSPCAGSRLPLCPRGGARSDSQI